MTAGGKIEQTVVGFAIRFTQIGDVGENAKKTTKSKNTYYFALPPSP